MRQPRGNGAEAAAPARAGVAETEAAGPEPGYWGRVPLEQERLALHYEMVPLAELKPWAENPRFNEGAVPKLMKLIEAHGFAGVIVATPDGVIRAGHTRFKAVQKLGWLEIPVEWKNFPTKEAAEEYALADNKSAEWADWNHELLGKLFKRRREIDLGGLMARTGFTKGQIRFVNEKGTGAFAGTLRERFGQAPFSVFNTMSGDWPERKRTWLGLGIQSEIGREGQVHQKNTLPEARGKGMTEKSVFDPVLTELMYEWFSPPGGQVVDPFAGGSVRGIVAAVLGRRYWGCDLGKEQVVANREQQAEIWGQNPKEGWSKPEWVVGDATKRLKEAPQADLLFSCPPYGDLEKYGNGTADLSEMPYEAFCRAYASIVRLAAGRLKPNRFAVFVVGNYRNGPHGFYRDLVGVTVRAFKAAGLGYYNEGVLLNPLGTLPMRIPRAFEAARKLGKAHQNVLIFTKGSPKLATAAIRPSQPKRQPQRVAAAPAPVFGGRP